MLMIGTCAIEDYEPHQVREEAAVNKIFCVPQDNLFGANYPVIAWKKKSKAGARPLKLAEKGSEGSRSQGFK